MSSPIFDTVRKLLQINNNILHYFRQFLSSSNPNQARIEPPSEIIHTINTHVSRTKILILITNSSVLITKNRFYQHICLKNAKKTIYYIHVQGKDR